MTTTEPTSAIGEADGASRSGRSHPTAVLAIILVSYLMIVLDISIVITALPKIHDGLGFSATGLSWVQNAYTLAFGGLLLLGARAGDIRHDTHSRASVALQPRVQRGARPCSLSSRNAASPSRSG